MFYTLNLLFCQATKILEILLSTLLSVHQTKKCHRLKAERVNGKLKCTCSHEQGKHIALRLLWSS